MTIRWLVILVGMISLTWAQTNIKVTCDVRQAEFYYVATTAGAINYLEQNGLRNFLESQRGKLKGPFIFDSEIALANVGGPDETHFFVLLRKKGYRDYYQVYPVQPTIGITWHSKRGPFYYPFTPVYGIPTLFVPFGTPQFVQDKPGRGKFHLWTQMLTATAATAGNFLAEKAYQDHLDARTRSLNGNLDTEARIAAAHADNRYIDDYNKYARVAQYSFAAFGALYTWQVMEGLFVTPGVNSPNWENPKPLFSAGVSATGAPMLAAGLQIKF